MSLDREQIISRYSAAIARVAASYEAIPALQQELTQEIAFAVWQSLERFRGNSSVETYIFRIAHNKAVNHVKKAMGQPKTQIEDTDLPSEHTMESALSKRQETEALMSAIRRLNFSDRQLISLSLEGFKQTQIAEIFGINENNVAVKLNRAKKSLKKLLERQPKDQNNE